MSAASPASLSTPLRLDSGVSLPNRLVKPALSECLADPATNLPGDKHVQLYARWSRGGIGAQLTGNVMIDRRYLESPGNVALEACDEAPERLATYAAWADAIHSGGSIALMQISHCGRQCPASVSSQPLAPSAIRLALPGVPGFLSPVGVPRAMTADDIRDVISRFAETARLAVKAGFDGVQIHSAHGYLLSSFLSARFNQRTDAYGGNAENRRRLLLEVVAAVRAAVGPERVVAIKLNSADFQTGGFTEEESLAVLRALHAPDAPKVDFVEISGGTYENAVMMKSREARERDASEDSAAAAGHADDAKAAAQTDSTAASASAAAPVLRESTRRREAFFLAFCERVRAACPSATLMLSGGWRSGIAMALAVRDGSVQLIGLGRPLCVAPDFPRALLTSLQLDASQLDSARSDALTLPAYSLAMRTPFAAVNKTTEAALENFFHQAQMERMSRGLEPDVHANLTLGSTLYFLSVQFVRAYLWEPRRRPKQTRAIQGVMGAASIALAAWAVLGSQRLRGIGAQAAVFAQQTVAQQRSALVR